MIFPQENPLPLQEIAVRLREDATEFLPDHIYVTVTASETADGSSITLTVDRWPADMPMLSHSRIFDERRAVLAGLASDEPATLPKTYHLSDEALLLADQLQALADRYQVVRDGKRNFTSEVAFNRRALDDERKRVLQSLKGKIIPCPD